MFDIIVKAAGFVFIIILGMFSRRIGLLKKEDSRILSKIIVTFRIWRNYIQRSDVHNFAAGVSV